MYFNGPEPCSSDKFKLVPLVAIIDCELPEHRSIEALRIPTDTQSAQSAGTAGTADMVSTVGTAGTFSTAGTADMVSTVGTAGTFSTVGTDSWPVRQLAGKVFKVFKVFTSLQHTLYGQNAHTIAVFNATNKSIILPEPLEPLVKAKVLEVSFLRVKHICHYSIHDQPCRSMKNMGKRIV